MFNGRHSVYRRGLIFVAILALSGWRGANAGLYTMEQTLADFSYDGASISYGRESPAATDDRGNAKGNRLDVRSSMEPTAQSYGTGDGLRGVMPLNAGQGIERDLVRGRFNVFGSIPKAASRPSATLLIDALDKMDEPTKTRGGPTFLNQDDRMTGSLATNYRGYGIYFSVSGLDELTWIDEMGKAIAKGGDIIELSSEEDGAGRAESAFAIPAPGTLALLLLGGLLVLSRQNAK